MDETGPVPVTPTSKTIPLEQLLQQQKQGQPDAAPNAPAAPAGLAPPSAHGAGGTVK
jgi:hypothetical protein